MIVFRKARPKDFETLKNILETVGLGTGGIDEHLDNFMVAEEGDTILATGGLEIYGDAAIIRSVAVLPEFQHQGIGDGLVRALINYGDRRGVSRIYLFTRGAAGFFEKFGFKAVELKDLDEKCKKSLQFNICSCSAVLMRLEVKNFFNNTGCRS
ncbi:GNAT family N-acetyltransferase [Thermosediminibacter litoriperuensis]|uniref:Amino-acid N-acetyltransferase n=1 Tax=Thermosediminibacter litoriperuensis TaxID=291989 RepID=A0A5S5AYT9_9FIRM|nr:GNAT family N-acetyltransferase [Thermosediminibacter litoriperuensis]TYP59875.1 amino-acid N-acetyltransferase [Thermosediminibacter litoriperuensis]